MRSLCVLSTILLIASAVTPLFADEPAAATRPTSQPAPQATVNPQADALLKRVAAAYSRIQAIELNGQISLTIMEDGKPQNHQSNFTSSFAAPNQFRHEAADQPLLGSTGQKVYGYIARRNLYTQTDAPATRPALADLPSDHASILSTQNLSLALALCKDPSMELKTMASEITLSPDQQIDGKPFPTLVLTLREEKAPLSLLVDPDTNLIRRTVLDLSAQFTKMGRTDVTSALFTVDYTVARLAASLKPESFAWAPPPGATDLADVRAAMTRGEEGGPHPLQGKPAPDFALNDLNGKTVKLSDLKGSVVMLDFWATWCGPCVMSLPHIDKIHQDLSKDGLKVYAVNLREDKAIVSEFLNKKALSLPVLLDSEGAVATQYAVEGIPTTVVIGKDGVIKTVLVGFNPDGEDDLRKTLTEAMAAPAGSAAVDPAK